MIKNKYLDAVSNAFGTLYCHDYLVETAALSEDILEHIQNFIEDGKLWGTKIIPTNGKGHIKVFTSTGIMNELDMSQEFKPISYHDPSNPQCSFCKIKYKEYIGMDKIEARLYPGCSSTQGFLKKNEKLQDVINQDEKTLKELNITYDQIANRIEYVQKRASYLSWKFDKENINADYWEEIKKGFMVDGLKVTWESYCGYQGCPYECEGKDALSDSDFTIMNPDIKKTIFCSELHPHLIRKHKFFEGHTKYRLDPKIAIEVLKIKPGVFYSLKYNTQHIWTMESGCSGGSNIDKLKQEKGNEEFLLNGTPVDFGKGICAYLLKDRLLILSEVSKIIEKTINDVLFREKICKSSSSIYRKTSFEYVTENKT